MIRPRPHLLDVVRDRERLGERRHYVRLDRNEQVEPWPEEARRELWKGLLPEALNAYPDPGPLYERPSAPAIYTDGNGNLANNPAVQAGGLATLYLNGAGDVTPALSTAYLESTNTTVTPVLPLSVTVGGIPAIVQFEGLAPLTVGTAQVNFYVPASLASGPQPVVVTVGGVASPPVNVTVQ